MTIKTPELDLPVASHTNSSHTGVSANPHGASDHTNRTRPIWVDALAMQPQPGHTAAVVTDTGTFYGGRSFTDSADNRVNFNVAIPEDWAGGNLTVELFYYLAANQSNKAIVWPFVVGPIATPGTTAVINWTVATTETESSITQNAEILRKYTSTSTYTPTAAGQLWRFNVGRLGNDGSDTVTGNVVLIGVKISYTADA